MAIKTIYICEKCGHEQLTADQFWTVGIQANHHGYAVGFYDFVEGKKMQVCRPCLESFGIHVSKKVEQDTKPAPPTLEELIAEIIARCAPYEVQ